MNEDIKSVVDDLARRYVRKCTWADVDELKQEGWLHALEAIKDRTFESTDHMRAYVWRVVSANMARFLWGQSSPVSCAKPERHTRGIKQIPLDHPVRDGLYIELPDKNELGAEQHVIARESAELVPRVQKSLRRELVRVYAKEHPNKRNPIVLEAAIYVLLNGTAPSYVAELAGVEAQEIYTATHQLKQSAMADAKVRKLMQWMQYRRADL